MLKGFRNLIQMIDDLDESEASEAARTPREPVAVELPQSLQPAADVPAAFIFDTDQSAATSLATILKVAGIEARSFAETGAFVRGLLTQPPQVVFLDVAEQGDGAVDGLFVMAERSYPGGVQLVAVELSPVVHVVRRMGERLGLQMLPPLEKPLPVQKVRQVLAAQNLKLLPAASATLREALSANLVEFWFQPKIDLGKRQIAGVELFARVRHPELGTLSPGIFMQGATEADLIRLTERGLGAALRSASGFCEAGIHLRVAVNVPVGALFALPVVDMIREMAPKNPRWPGLLLDVTVGQLAADLGRMQELGAELAAVNTRLAIDDFGRGSLSLTELKQLPVAELKLDRSFVNGCADDPARAKVCASVVELAHHIGCVAVAVGIERNVDAAALAEMGCDVGQGYLFGEPMPEENLAAMLMRRVVASSAVQPLEGAAPDVEATTGNVELASPSDAAASVTKTKMRSRRPTPASRSTASLKRSVWS
jgi:EAL domain-containing protein (putative c-di-GMP-specific phosphodiesterase class I)